MDIFAPFVFLIIYINLHCHTVAYANKRLGQYDSSQNTIELFKRESEPGNASQAPILNTAENRTIAADGINNRTSSQVKRPITNGAFNITHSLPAWMDTIKSGALQRTGFVALGFMLIIVIFFVVRGIRLRRKKSKSRKYGIITSTDMEMEPLDKDEDDEEETTLFDAQQKYSLH